jgi:hypothetical protein
VVILGKERVVCGTLLLVLLLDRLVKVLERDHVLSIDELELGDKEEKVAVVGVQVGFGTGNGKMGVRQRTLRGVQEDGTGTR